MSSVSFEPRNDHYRICSFFAQGLTRTAAVYVARHTVSGTLVALKKYNMEKLTREELELIQEEIILMKQLNHASVLKVISSFVADQKLIVILPLMGFGSAADVIIRNFPTGLPEPAIATILKSVLHALVYLHSRGIIHRAIRGSHILISASGQVTVTGLRYSCPIITSGRWQKKVHSYPAFTMAPNMNWLSPEILQQNLEGYDEKSDVYSVGVTACELANGVVPYFGTPATLMLIEKVKGIPRTLLDATTYITNEDDGSGDEGRDEEDYSHVIANRRFSNAFHSATERCLETLKVDRLSARELLSHSFFKSALPSSALPRSLKPAIPILQGSLAENYDDMASVLARERLNNMEINTTVWDFGTD